MYICEPERQNRLWRKTVWTAKTHGWQTVSKRSLSILPNYLNGWINYLNGLVSHLNRWVKQIMSNGLASHSNRWKCYQSVWLVVRLVYQSYNQSIVQMTKLLKQFAKPFLAHGLIREWAMLLCIFFHFICCCSQFQGLYSHDQKWRLFQFVIKIMFIVIVLNYWISHERCLSSWLIVCLTI